jgi:hypothetical protein
MKSTLTTFFWDSAKSRLRTAWRLLLQVLFNVGGIAVFSGWVIPHTWLNSWPRLAVEAVIRASFSRVEKIV